MRKILRNKTIAALLILTLLVLALGVLKVHWIQSELAWRDGELAEYEWLVPLGLYDVIYVAELDEGVFYRAGKTVETAGIPDSGYEELVLDAEGREVTGSVGMLEMFDVSSQYMEVQIHPAGYGIIEERAGSDAVVSYDVRNLDGELLYREPAEMLGGQLQLTEEPGYVISLTKNAVIDLETGRTVFEAPENERILSQAGGFWQMELELPWYENGETLPVAYLRDMDFQVALDGKLSSGWSQAVSDGLMIGDVVVNGTYYHWPEEVIAVEWCVLDAAGNNVEFPEADLSRITLMDEGFFCTVNEEEQYRIHFTGDKSWFDLPEEFRPMDVVTEDVFAVRYNKEAGKGLADMVYLNNSRFGFMDWQGNLVTEPIFSRASNVRGGCAVVWYEGQTGIIRLKGGGADEE